MAFNLESITRGKRLRAPKIVVYGPPKIGKTTFASSAPGSIGVITEEGTDAVDCAAFPICRSYDDVLQCLGTLYTEQHEFKSVFLDSLDWLEPLIHQHICVTEKVDSIEKALGGYGKGYMLADKLWRQVFDGLDALRNTKNMIIVAVAHEQVTSVKDPTLGENYDAYSLKLNKRAVGLINEWADIIGFANYRTMTRTVDAGFNKKEHRAMTTGERLLHLNPHPAYVAGNRYGIPDVPLSWPHFEAAMHAAMQPAVPAAAPTATATQPN